MARWKDLTGKRFARLTVIEYVGNNKHGKSKWLCKCDCGNEITTLANGLTSGRTGSCGCLRKERLVNMNKDRGTHGMKNTPEYRTWRGMKARCLNKNHTAYNNYGDRGITVCDRWINSFECFLEDMGKRPDGTTIDRINNEGDYEPSNCRWETKSIQIRNRRISITVEYNGVDMPLLQACKLAGIKYQTVYSRLRKGMDAKSALTLKGHLK